MEFILKLRSNDPAVGYNRRPKFRSQQLVLHADARLWHPWLRINRVLRVMLHTHWSAEAWSQVRVEFKKAPLRSEIRRARIDSAEYLGRSDLDGGIEGDRV